MDERISKIAALANAAAYDAEATKDYVDSAPHIKHLSLRTLYAKLLTEVYEYAVEYSPSPRALDLGAGEGSVTLPLLELGARVTAVDLSSSQLKALGRKCERFGDRLELRHEDASETLRTRSRPYDIIVANSFLHHIPDYLGLIREAMELLTSYGQFFSFQDPLRYDTLGKPTKAFCDLAYLSWRVFKGDVWGGFQRRIRRSRGVYLIDSVQDNAEYHVTRNGVDQDAIADMFKKAGFQCTVVRYFSTQSPLFQPIGAGLGVKNCFGVVARRDIKAANADDEKPEVAH